jgi:hypothetical protein
VIYLIITIKSKFIIYFFQEVNNYGRIYGRLRTPDGQYVSSFWIQKKDKIARNNHCVQVKI